jgi:ribose transport system ATP-binding protein
VEDNESLCTISNLKKNYGGVEALKGVGLTVHPGTVHAVVGENGAGKSTLMKILAGAVRPDEGTVLLNGHPAHFSNVQEANQHGVAIVFQELSLFPHLDVLSNLFLRREDTRFGMVDRRSMERKATPILEELELEVDLATPVGKLRIGEQQLVEIAKALLLDSRILILDEPNSALNAHETKRLFQIIRRLKERGIAVIYVSHRLEEVFDISDKVTVMRNGRVAADMSIEETTISEVVSLMLGRDPQTFYHDQERHAPAEGRDALALEDVTIPGEIESVSVTAHTGEVVGLIGLEGAGVQAVFDVVYGVKQPQTGRVIRTDSGEISGDMSDRVRNGMAYIPNDRQSLGLMLRQSIMENLSVVSGGVQRRFGFILDREAMVDRSKKRIRALSVATPSHDVPVNSLSGGNQQKVLLGRWLEAEPDVILLNDPTRGVDVGAKEEIYHLIRELSDQGKIVLFASSEVPEYVHLCDRVYVFYRGEVCGQVKRETMDENTLVEAINTGTIPNGRASGATNNEP